MSRRNDKKAGRVALAMVLALVVVAGVSLLPLERWSGGRIRNFNLLADIMPDSLLAAGSLSTEGIDPELLRQLRDSTSVASERDSLGRPLFTDTIIGPVQPMRAPDGTVIIEDYTAGSVGLYNLRRALRSGRMARVAFVGDSYIEGDILTQDLRELLQQAYGGSGVGYVAMHSDFPGFRRSVRQSSEGWEMVKKAKDHEHMGLMELYGRPKGNARSAFEGVSALDHAGSWDVSRILALAPQGATVLTRLADKPWQEHTLPPSDSVQAIVVKGYTTSFEVKASAGSLKGLGVWLEADGPGIGLDCMSSRGHSGVSLTNVKPDFAHDMARHVGYDLVILEFGINAMSSGQKNYTPFADQMVRMINNVRLCYPGADILLLGIGDRGERRGGTVRSMAGAEAMEAAQRQAARRSHVMFWNTRQAMGGDDAIVAWSGEGYANKDYVHLTHKGGKRLAGLLFKALRRAIGPLGEEADSTAAAAAAPVAAPSPNLSPKPSK